MDIGQAASSYFLHDMRTDKLIPQHDFWMVWGEGQGAPTMKHANFDAAKREAERLSRNNPNIAFFVMMPVSRSKRVDVETTMLVDVDQFIPF